MKKVCFLVLFLLILSSQTVSAGDVLFETTLPWYYWWSTMQWGSGSISRTNQISIRYTPIANQEVCTIKPGLYKSGNPTDSIVLTVRESGNGYPTGGTVIGTSTVPADQVSSPPILPQQSAYTVFAFSHCLNLTADTNYFFVFSRTQLPDMNTPDLTNWYALQLTNHIYYPQTAVWGYVPVNVFWNELTNYEPALRLEGPDAPILTPVLIIPGIAGSELKNGDDLIWADLGQMFFDVNDEFLTENLALDNDGDSVNNINVGNVVESINDEIITGLPIINTFLGLRSDLIDNGYILNQDLFYFPYDWRLDLSSTASLLADRIDEIKSQTGSEKVDIVAHSMGGLLTKEYIRQSGPNNINKLIFVGTPHLGAPKAGEIILAGDRMGIPWLEEDRVEEIGEHSIAVHELLPNQTYFNLAGPYIKKLLPFDTYNLFDYDETKQFLINNGSAPAVFATAESFFANDLENIDLSSMDVYNIAGCSSGTQGGYGVRADGTIAFAKYRSGDQTVPLISGDGISLPVGNKFYSTEGAHAELPSWPGIRDLISDILNDQPLANYDNVYRDISNCGIEGQELIWRSPVEVHIFDSQNRHTGPMADNAIEYGIPGVDYEIFGHEKYIFIPSDNGEVYQVVAHGLDNGIFDLIIRQNNNGTVEGATVFNDIPVTLLTDILFNITNNPVDTIEVDEEGDGSFVSIEATTTLNGEEAEDINPPIINIVSPDSLYYERSEILPVDVQINDNNSGVLFSVITLDNSFISSSSVDLFFYSLGSHSLNVIAIDRAGNTATSSFDFQAIATPDSTMSDVERAFELGWIEKRGIKNGLVQKLKTAIKMEKRVELLEEKLPNRPKVIKRIERLEKQLDKVLGTSFLKQLEKEYNRDNINEQAYNLLKEDIEWLLDK